MVSTQKCLKQPFFYVFLKDTTELYRSDGKYNGTKTGLVHLRVQEVTTDMGLNFTAPQLINGTERTCSLFTAGKHYNLPASQQSYSIIASYCGTRHYIGT